MKFQDDDGEDEDDSGEAEDIHYKDFFDPAQRAPDPADLPEASGSSTKSCLSELNAGHLVLDDRCGCGRGQALQESLCYAEQAL